MTFPDSALVIKKIKNMNQLELAKVFDVTRQTMSRWEKGKGGPSPAEYEFGLKKLNLTEDDIVNYGRNVTLHESPARYKPLKKREVGEIEGQNFKQVPVVTQSAQSAYARGCTDPDYIESLPTYPMPIDRYYQGKYRIFEVDGDSMDNGLKGSISHGEKLFCREVTREHWYTKLNIRDWLFVIVTINDGIVVKQITHHDAGRGIITCHSYNSLYPDFILRLETVAEIYNVVESLVRRRV